MSLFTSQNKWAQWAVDLGCFILGSCLYAISVSVFAAPNQIAPGGLTGVSTILHTVFHTPIGAVIMILNIPIIFWGLVEIGFKIVIKTIVAIVISSTIIDLSALILPTYHGDTMLAALFAGVLEGAGLALFFLRGGTTGGTDMTARILNKRFPHWSMGKLMFGIDMMVIIASAIVYRSTESGLYALLVVFVATRVIDAILYGMDLGTGKMLFIISEQNKEIAAHILKNVSRGVTILNAKGAYSQQDRAMLFCAVRKYEVHRMLQMIRSIDKKAFVIIGEAGQIAGEGFKEEAPPDKTVKEILFKRKNAKDSCGKK